VIAMDFIPFQRKHGTAERWDVCQCEECLEGKGIVTCEALVPEVMALMRGDAKDSTMEAP